MAKTTTKRPMSSRPGKAKASDKRAIARQAHTHGSRRANAPRDKQGLKK